MGRNSYILFMALFSHSFHPHPYSQGEPKLRASSPWIRPPPSSQYASWSIHSLLSARGIRDPNLSIRDVRRIILLNRDKFIEMTGPDMEVWLLNPVVHDELILSNPMVSSSVKAMMYVLACDSPITPRWNDFAEDTNSYLASLCCWTLILTERPLRDMPRELTADDRQGVIRSMIDKQFSGAVRAMAECRRQIARNSRRNRDRHSTPVTAPPRRWGSGRYGRDRGGPLRHRRNSADRRGRADTPGPEPNQNHSGDSDEADTQGLFGVNRAPRGIFKIK